MRAYDPNTGAVINRPGTAIPVSISLPWSNNGEEGTQIHRCSMFMTDEDHGTFDLLIAPAPGTTAFNDMMVGGHKGTIYRAPLY